MSLDCLNSIKHWPSGEGAPGTRASSPEGSREEQQLKILQTLVPCGSFLLEPHGTSASTRPTPSSSPLQRPLSPGCQMQRPCCPSGLSLLLPTNPQTQEIVRILLPEYLSLRPACPFSRPCLHFGPPCSLPRFLFSKSSSLFLLDSFPTQQPNQAWKSAYGIRSSR